MGVGKEHFFNNRVRFKEDLEEIDSGARFFWKMSTCNQPFINMGPSSQFALRLMIVMFFSFR